MRWKQKLDQTFIFAFPILLKNHVATSDKRFPNKYLLKFYISILIMKFGGYKHSLK